MNSEDKDGKYFTPQDDIKMKGCVKQQIRL